MVLTPWLVVLLGRCGYFATLLQVLVETAALVLTLSLSLSRSQRAHTAYLRLCIAFPVCSVRLTLLEIADEMTNVCGLISQGYRSVPQVPPPSR